ncbi:MAG: NAD(P)-dependent oxidoreductase, partial [Bryocella sp.]
AAEDLAHVLQQTHEAFAELRGARIFLTGGTGFFGHWLLESLLHANRELRLDLRVTVLSRNPAAFAAKSPHLVANPALTLLAGDIASFPFPVDPHTHILHAATDSGGQQTSLVPGELASSILAGTERVLAFAHQTNARRLLYTSTGAVYGRSTTLLHTPESFLQTNTVTLQPDSYEDAKQKAEALILTHPELDPVIARCFAFVGPHLPLDQHFAIGNFLGATISGQPIHIKGDGTPRRSWLYMADLVIWLWTMLSTDTPSTIYNVGSDDGMTIAAAAKLTAATLHPSLPIQIDGTPIPDAPLNSYVPNIERARSELGLTVTIPLDEALRRTARWHGFTPTR